MGIFGANYGANYNLLADTTNPTISISSPADLSTNTTPLVVSGVSADNIAVSVVEVQIDGGAFETATGTTSWTFNITTLTNGSHTITARATDTSSNTATDSITITVLNLGGGVGGRVKKSIGHQLTDLGPRPHIIQKGESTARLVLQPINKSKSKLLISVKGESVCKIIPYFGGVSISKLVIPVKAESTAHLYYKSTGESWAVPHPSILMEKVIRKTGGIGKALKAMNYLHMLESVDSMFEGNNSNIISFSFNEEQHNEQLIAFTHTSTWIGNVRYDTEAKTMRILMNGKAFTHCGVERADYDRFEGAPSKGEHWWRFIKDQFNC